MFEVNIKSGTSGWFDEDGCDMGIAEIESNNIPRVDDALSISKYNRDTGWWGDKHYLVRSIERSYVFDKETGKQSEFITVYVIEI